MSNQADAGVEDEFHQEQFNKMLDEAASIEGRKAYLEQRTECHDDLNSGLSSPQSEQQPVTTKQTFNKNQKMIELSSNKSVR